MNLILVCEIYKKEIGCNREFKRGWGNYEELTNVRLFRLNLRQGGWISGSHLKWATENSVAAREVNCSVARTAEKPPERRRWGTRLTQSLGTLNSEHKEAGKALESKSSIRVLLVWAARRISLRNELKWREKPRNSEPIGRRLEARSYSTKEQRYLGRCLHTRARHQLTGVDGPVLHPNNVDLKSMRADWDWTYYFNSYIRGLSINGCQGLVN